MIQEVPKMRWSLEEARVVAEMLVTQLEDCCERIIIAGSIRRNKSQVGDIELLFIPKIVERQNPDSLLPEIQATSEQHVFELCGQPYQEPEKRI